MYHINAAMSTKLLSPTFPGGLARLASLLPALGLDYADGKRTRTIFLHTPLSHRKQSSYPDLPSRSSELSSPSLSSNTAAAQSACSHHVLIKAQNTVRGSTHYSLAILSVHINIPANTMPIRTRQSKTTTSGLTSNPSPSTESTRQLHQWLHKYVYQQTTGAANLPSSSDI